MKTFLSLTVTVTICLLSLLQVHAQTPVPCEVPYPQVQNLQAAIESQSVELTWTPIIGSIGCRIQLRQSGQTAWQMATIVQPDLDAFSISGNFLVYQSDYEARVACGCSASPVIIGPYSEIVSFNSGAAGQQVPCENPYPEVLNPSAAPNAEGNAFVLSWEPIPQSAGCQIEYSLLEGGVLNAAQVLQTALSSYSIPATDLIPNQDYQWRVRCGCSLNPLVAGPWIEYQEFNSGDVGVDCPNLGGNIGDACDDGDESTLNDEIAEDCECVGINLCPDNIPEGTVCNPLTGRVWMDRNLGASQVANSLTDQNSYGDLYQWGRGQDGHQNRNSPTTTTLSNSDQPSNGSFIVLSFLTSNGGDWRSPRNDNLWQGESGINNPCPEGFRIPTLDEWTEELNTWNSQDPEGAFSSVLKLPAAGARDFDGSLDWVGQNGYYWSSSVSAGFAGRMAFTLEGNGFPETVVNVVQFYRIYGRSVRCIQD